MDLCRRNDQAGALAEWDHLAEQYGQAGRAYHTLEHLASCLVGQQRNATDLTAIGANPPALLHRIGPQVGAGDAAS